MNNTLKHQILFKLQMDDHECNVQQKHQRLSISKILTLNPISSIHELIIEDEPHFILDQKCQNVMNKFTHLIYLGINGCNLKSLIFFPQIPSLRRITLDNNNITNNELENLIYYKEKKLISLSIIDNKLRIDKSSKVLQFLIKFNKLKQISFMGNMFGKDNNEKTKRFYQKYIEIRELLFKILPNLLYIDNIHRKKEFYIIHLGNQKQQNLYLNTDIIDSVQTVENVPLLKKRLRKREPKCYKT